MATQVHVDGVERLRRTLDAAGVDLADLKAALTKAAAIVEQTASATAPVRDGDLVSTLRSSATKKAGIIRAGRKTVPYAGPVHWGWPKRGIRPQPWIADAAKNTEPAWVAMFEREVDTILDTIKGA